MLALAMLSIVTSLSQSAGQRLGEPMDNQEPAPVETDNSIRLADGEQSVTQDPVDDYSEGGDD